jgi:hypothetical protein
MEKLIIPVANWLHREGGAASALLRPEDGKRCCLGIYLEDNCGISPVFLSNTAAPDLLPDPILAKLPRWLTIHRNNTALAEALMSANDDEDDEGDEETTRENVRALFATADIEVEFCET